MTQTLKVLAIADTHISETMRLGGTAPTEDGRPLVLVQAERMLAWVAEVAERESVDLILHAGDLYEQPNPRPAAEAVAVAALLRFARIAPTIVIPGNHDRPRGGGVHALEPLRDIMPGRLFIADTPEPVHLFADGESVGTDTVDQGAVLLTVFPLPFPELGKAARGHGDAKAAVSHALNIILEQHALLARNCDHPTAVLFHGTMAGAKFNDYQTAPLGDVGVRVGGLWSAFDIQAAGHLHKRQLAPGLAASGYIGAPDRHDFGEENETAGISLFTIFAENGSRVVDDELIHYPGARQFVTLQVGSGSGLRHIEEHDPANYTPDGVSGGFICGVTLKPTRIIYRFKGELSPLNASRVAAAARAWRARGWIISNQTTTERADRARVRFEADAIGSRSKILDAVFAAKPALGEHREQVTVDVDEVWPD